MNWDDHEHISRSSVADVDRGIACVEHDGQRSAADPKGPIDIWRWEVELSYDGGGVLLAAGTKDSADEAKSMAAKANAILQDTAQRLEAL